MRELSTPSLFDSSIPALSVVPAREVAPEENRIERLAKEFVRWCFSFGTGFRNSPDVINLRFWAQKTKLKLKAPEEHEMLVEARKLFMKRVEQMMKKADAPILKAEPDALNVPAGS